MKMPIRAAVELAACTVVTFAIALALEWGVVRANEASATTAARIRELNAALMQRNMSRQWNRAIEQRIAEFHLRDSPSMQCAILLSEFERIAVAHHLRIVSIKRDATSMRSMPAPEYDLYDLAVEGSYRSALSALADLSHLPLLTRVKAANFERVSSAQTSVRMSLQLQLYRMSANVRRDDV